MKFKKLNDNILKKISKEVKLLLHAERDRLRNFKENTLRITFNVNGPYYCEAFGMFRALKVLNYGSFASVNLDGLTDPNTCNKAHRAEQNFSWYFDKLQKEVLEEEGFYSNHRCLHCLKRYRKDDLTYIENSGNNFNS